MSHRLDTVFRFSSIAVIGATESSGFGAGPRRALNEVGFQGRYYPVNPRRDTIGGERCYPSISAIPEPVEFACIVVRAELVPTIFAEAITVGIKGASIISAGFAEAGPEGAALQEQVARLARASGVPVIGPNCFGIASRANRCAGYSGGGLAEAREGGVAVVSNSGGILNEILGWGTTRLLGFSHVVSTGNEANVTAAEVIDYFVQDPATEVILAVLESVRDPRLFLQAVDRAAAVAKPIVVLKIGSSAKGARAARTHTAALTGSDEVYDALFKQKGITRVRDLDELIEVGVVMSHARPILGQRPLERAGVIEISGGGTGVVSDIAEAVGLELPDFSPETQAALRTVLLDRMSGVNPLDTGSSWIAPEIDQIYPTALEALASDPQIDIIVSRYNIPTTSGLHRLGPRFDELEAARAAHPDRLFPILSRTADRVSPEFIQRLDQGQHLFLQGYGKGLGALGRLAAYSRFLRARRVGHGPDPAIDAAAVRARSGRDGFDEVEAKDLLRAAGLPVIATGLATTPDDAVSLARRYGYPVAAKVVSPQILHKTDVGGVRLNLRSDDEVRVAFDALRGAAARVPGAEFRGAAIMPMAPGGVELVFGASRDEQFGPVVLVGFGGILVEVLHDVALGVTPLHIGDALAMLERLRARALLDGYRGLPVVDRRAVAEALVRLGQVMETCPEIASIDLNPVLATADGLVAVDARVVLGS